MKTVSIITLHYINNYGSVLQSLATQVFFENMGFKAEIVDIVRENYKFDALLESVRNNMKKRSKYVEKSKCLQNLLIYFWKKQYAREKCLFDAFRNQHLHLTKNYMNEQELLKCPPLADVYCTGSDQVWNWQYNDGLLSEYFLSYAPDDKLKIAYSASFGRTELTEDECKNIYPLLKKYKIITVRETSALTLLENMGISNARFVLDPTLMISKEEWHSLIPLHNLVKQEYVLLYQLNRNKQMEEFSKDLAKKHNVKLITISQSAKAFLYGGKVKRYPSVNEFLSLINFAKFVVTDSFHGTAFSINFEKQLFVFYPPKYSTRLSSILNYLDIGCRAIENNKNDAFSMAPIDYSLVTSKLNEARSDMRSYISEAIIDG